MHEDVSNIRGGRILDARGNPRSLCRTRDLPRSAVSARLAVFTAHDKSPRSVALFWIITAAVGFAFFGTPYLLRGDHAMLRFLLIGAMIVYPPLIMLAMVLSSLFRSRRLRRAVRTCLAEGLCPACAYRLDDLPRTVDVDRICPECGAAWP